MKLKNIILNIFEREGRVARKDVRTSCSLTCIRKNKEYNEDFEALQNNCEDGQYCHTFYCKLVNRYVTLFKDDPSCYYDEGDM